jgi:hypothetical protein
MSSERSGKSHALAWISAPLVGLLLYVATWPPIEIKATQVTHFTSSTPTGGVNFITQIVHPAWLGIYSPLQRLRDSGGEHGLCARYWAWWQQLLA